MTATYAPFDPADYLDSDEMITAYLLAALEELDPSLFLAAVGDITKVHCNRILLGKTKK